LGILENNMAAFRPIGATVSDTTSAVQPYHGFLATTATSATATLGTSAIRQTSNRAYWNYVQTAL